ncbi:uncharacterized protein LOC107641307 [Arachis ipaensis]|uniref:uncharacterized protein LOC107641307 n=1 Tax=Arachis ipaensis TaxID=130454 RepID=UPI0007AF13F2|nr:uncharacterized protein LOC107641307 [Arachis ipaensis]
MAFLHGELDEEVYMKVLPGLEVSPGQVCKLKKSLYGLKQASRQWNCKLKSVLLELKFTPRKSDYSLFTKITSRGFTAILVNSGQYRRIVGKLLYLSNTRLDISYAIGKQSKFLVCATTEHLKAAHRVLRYIKASPAASLFFSANYDLQLTGFSEFDWAGCVDSRRSI